MPKINREEYEVLKGLDDKWKWIARDKDRGLYAFTEKPVRKYAPSPYWDTETERPYTALELIDETHLFHFIQWEDEEPYNIAELIEEYEDSKEYKDSLAIEYFMDKAKESEETEVKKDLEWLKREIGNMQYTRLKRVGMEDYVSISKRGVLELIDQLDEPEVLSQELPVIPKFVAYVIEVYKSNSRLTNLLADLAFHGGLAEFVEHEDEYEVFEWARSNRKATDEILARAWLDGFTVEEEQTYYLKIGNLYLAEPLGDMTSDIVRMTRDKGVAYQFTDKKSIATHLDKFEGTEAVKAEELEE